MTWNTLDCTTLNVSGTMTVGNAFTGQSTLSAPVLTATATMTLPDSVPAGLIAARLATAAATTTYAVNLATGAITQWDWSPDVSVTLVSAHGRLYGLRTDGTLFRMAGDTDEGGAIASTLRFAPQDFGTDLVKRLPAIYLNLRAPHGMTATLLTDEVVSWSYQSAGSTGDSPALRPQKIKTGRGVTFHSLGLVLTNRQGGDWALESMELPITPLSRRVP